MFIFQNLYPIENKNRDKKDALPVNFKKTRVNNLTIVIFNGMHWYKERY